MPTLEENVNRVKAAKTAIGNAITAKGGTVGANDGLEDFASDIASIPSGGGSSNDDVRFIDYDGTIIQTYSAADFANLTELPENPSHTGLTAQGWNWSLSDAKTYVAANGKLVIGQMYTTSDGKTRLYINLLDDYKSPTLEIYFNKAGSASIDWGDGSASTFTASGAGYQSENHIYDSSGDYIISISANSGILNFKANNNQFSILKGTDTTSNKKYRESLCSIEIGNSFSTIENYAFQNCYSLSTLTLPNTISYIGNYAFNINVSIKSITLPNTITSVKDYLFNGCNALKTISIPNNITTISQYAFQNCYSLSTLTLPNTITTISQYAFSGCKSLTSLAIPNNISGLGIAVFKGTSLSDIKIPNSVTSINDSAFGDCGLLLSVTIPSSVTTISQYCFSNCKSSFEIIYLGSTLPSGQPWGADNSHVKITTAT